MKELTKDDMSCNYNKAYYVRSGNANYGMITHTGYYSRGSFSPSEPGNFTVRLFEGITVGNGFQGLDYDSLNELITAALDRGLQIFEFNSMEDLMVHHLSKFCHKIDPQDDEAVVAFFELINGV